MSRLHATVEVEKPETVPVTMKLTMALEHWKALRSQITGSGYPAWAVKEAIDKLIAKIESQITESLRIDP